MREGRELCTSPESRLDAYEEGNVLRIGSTCAPVLALVSSNELSRTQESREDAKANHEVVFARHPTFPQVRLKRRGHLANEGKWDPILKRPVDT